MLKIYVCGPTVYNDVHIGNLRPIITIDLILKAARELGIDFKFIHNITDIDDKIINKAILENKSESEISNLYSERYLSILETFNVDTITNLEYVTKNIDTINDFLNLLKNSNSAYLDNESNLWFDVQKYQDHYGIVSKQKLDYMVFEDNSYIKKFPADFALWKKTNKGVVFSSSFGDGRPGWHTECVALVYKHFKNDSLDFHGGGMDLTFPHHENENIQYYALTNKDITKKWLRTGQINLNGQKMSKSLQNVFLAKDFLEKYSPDIFKIILLINNITSLINIDENTFNNAFKIIKKIKSIYFQAHLNNIDFQKVDKELVKSIMQSLYETKFSDFMKKINDLIKSINVNKNEIEIASLMYLFDKLGFDFQKTDFKHFVKIYDSWQALLKEKNFEKADKYREILINENLI